MVILKFLPFPVETIHDAVSFVHVM